MRPLAWDDFLRASAVPPHLVAQLLDESGWARFDPELGYVNRSSAIPWGIDGTRTIGTYGPEGARTSLMHSGRRPRVTTYGDSFTQCQHVSDGETWQEYLAGHLGEPVANYGVGGSGLYQAYRRMRREEAHPASGTLVVLGFTGGTAYRSLFRTLWPSVYGTWPSIEAGLPIVHGNFWPYLELDLGIGRFRERENSLRTAERLRLMSDPEWMLRALRDDLPLRLTAVAQGRVPDLDIAPTARLARLLGTTFDPDPARAREEASRLGELLGDAATSHIVGLADDLARRSGKRLLVALHVVGADIADPHARIRALLERRGIPVFDMHLFHRAEHAESRLPYEEHLARYFAGEGDAWNHYNPRGNHLFAYAVKDTVVDLIGSEPLPYRRDARDVDDMTAHRLLRLGIERPELHPGVSEILGGLPRLGSVLDALDADYSEPWDVGRMAAIAGVTRSTLYRRFAETVRISPMEYLKRVRLDKAAVRLTQTDATIDRIAAEVGFANRFHLSREFTRRFGVTPSEYRRRPSDPATA